MYSRLIFNFIFLLFIAGAQIAFVPALPAWLAFLDAGIVAAVFVVALNGLASALELAVGLGLLSGLFDFGPPGSELFKYIVAVLVGYLFLEFVLTNRSLYSFAVSAAFMILAKNLVLGFYAFGWVFFTQSNLAFAPAEKIFWLALGKEMAVNFLAIAVVFYLVNFISNRLKPVFLLRRK